MIFFVFRDGKKDSDDYFPGGQRSFLREMLYGPVLTGGPLIE